MTALIIHGHFYQPPRENPWTNIVDREPSAAPFHDWNGRINRECYRPNAWARIFNDRGSIRHVVNNYRHVSYNFGPTLLSWLLRHDPRTYRRIIEADRQSIKARGHGNAIAQGYNHAILPLCNDRDLRTQVRWGLFDFRHRFGRDADALWMPETACDDRTLGVLIDEGLKFALLAPGQAARVRNGDGDWIDVSDGSVDPRLPYRYMHRDGSGRSIALFFYDGGISRSIAFEGALSSSHALLERFERAAAGGDLVHAVTDGESYGHHFKFGDRCLAHALGQEATRRGFDVTNYAAYLEQNPPELEAEVGAGDDGRGTSWSCAHGVGRWFRDCGCHTGGKEGYDQKWRTPLRDALDLLRDDAARLYESQMGDLCDDPWALRDAYIELVVAPRKDRKAFLERQLGRPLDEAQLLTALRLLESQRSSMLMYTSCGWFFNDLSGIETLQIMRYAGLLIDQLAALGRTGIEQDFLAGLAEASSNDPDAGNGADLYRAEVTPVMLTSDTLAAHISLAGLTREMSARGELAGYDFEVDKRAKDKRGRIMLATSHVTLTHVATGEQSAFASCALHFGGVDLHCVQKPYEDEERYQTAVERIWDAVGKGSLLTLLRVAEEELGPQDYGIDAVLPSARDAISRSLFDEVRQRYAAQYEAMYTDARLSIAQFHDAGLPLPSELRNAAELALAYRFDEEMRVQATGFDRTRYERALSIVRVAKRYGCALRREAAHRHFEKLLDASMAQICKGAGSISAALALLDTAEQLSLSLDMERAQEELYDALARGDLKASEELDELTLAVGLQSSCATSQTS